MDWRALEEGWRPGRAALRTFAAVAAALTLGALSPAPAAAQVTSYAFIPNQLGGTVSVIDTRTAAVVATIPISLDQPTVVAPTPDGRRVYVVRMAADDVVVVDVATMMKTGSPIAVGDLPRDIAITPDGRKVYVPNYLSDTISVIETATDTVARTITSVGFGERIAVRPDGQQVWVTQGITGGISIIDTVTDTEVHHVNDPDHSSYDISFTPDGQRAFITLPNAAKLREFDPDAPLTSIPVTFLLDEPGPHVVTKDGAFLLNVDYAAPNLRIVDLDTKIPSAPIAVGTRPSGIALTPDGKTAFIPDQDEDVVRRFDVTSQTFLPGAIAVGDGPLGRARFIGPNIIMSTCGGCGALTIAGDADLEPLGFARFVNFNAGTLSLTGNWTTSRAISLLAGGGTIQTNGFDATVTGDVLNDGALTKDGAGTLTLDGAASHDGGTTVLHGTLIVNGSHDTPVHLQDGTLAGHGTIAAVDAIGGTISPGLNGSAILTVGDATLGSAVTFVVNINGTTAGSGYDRLAAADASLGNATLDAQLGYTPTVGETFTIVTNATGTFAALPEGTLLTIGGAYLRITYHGGAGADVMLTVVNAPTPDPPVNLPPTIGNLTDRSMHAGGTLDPIVFNIGDDTTAPAALVVTATSSNQSLLPDATIILGGSGTSRTLTATPVPGLSGTTTITVSVFDGQATTERTFTLTVIPLPTYYLAEGATGGFFSTDILLANPHPTPAPVVITFFMDDGSTIVTNLTLLATSRTTVRAHDVAGLEAAAFSTSVTSTSGVPLVVERTMSWDATGYASHTEKASAAAAARWYFAEGSQGYFHTYFLVLNPHGVDTVAHVTYLLEDGPSVQREYPMPARARVTIDAGAEPALLNRSFGTLIELGLPGMAERAMYFGTTPQFSGGHGAAGVTAPSTNWFLAEGATGTFFDTFVLIANPNDAAANLTLTYLPDTGIPVVKTHALQAHQRLTLNIAEEDPTLASAAVSTVVASDQPVIAERSQYWPHRAWHEAHTSAGETSAGTRWGLAEGRVGGAMQAQTYILIANPGVTAAEITATFLRTDGTTLVKSFTVPPTSRFNIGITGPDSLVPELADEAFGTIIASTEPVLVERSVYANADGVVWAAGTNTTATRLP